MRFYNTDGLRRYANANRGLPRLRKDRRSPAAIAKAVEKELKELDESRARCRAALAAQTKPTD